MSHPCHGMFAIVFAKEDIDMDDGKNKLDRLSFLFVYGTLRKGFPNHFFLEKGIFCGSARTKERYALFAGGLPYASKDLAISIIVGEVFQVDGKTLGRIDQLEGHPDCYRREKAEVILKDGAMVWAWIYFNPSPRGRLIKSGDYAESTTLKMRRQ
jgi:gamma-glutamylaminecyclotransferase